MFDTYLTIVGNVLTAPQWRRTTQTNALVANFKVASTSRRFDREANRWTDGNSVRVRVNCWRRLAEGVASSLMVGDPVVVVGRLYTREWTDEHEQRRLMYEMEAVAVGHDLARGRGKFYRTRPNTSTSMVEGGEAEARVNGEPTEQVRNDEAPATYGAGLPHDPDDFDALSASALAYDPLGALGYAPALGSTASGDGELYAREGVVAGDRDGAGPDGEQAAGGRTDEDAYDDVGLGVVPVGPSGGGEEPARPEGSDGVDARRGRRRVRTPVPV